MLSDAGPNARLASSGNQEPHCSGRGGLQPSTYPTGVANASVHFSRNHQFNILRIVDEPKPNHLFNINYLNLGVFSGQRNFRKDDPLLINVIVGTGREVIMNHAPHECNHKGDLP